MERQMVSTHSPRILHCRLSPEPFVNSEHLRLSDTAIMRRLERRILIYQRERDPERVGALYAAAVQEHAVLQRSAIVNRLYGGWRLVVENQKPLRDRGDT